MAKINNGNLELKYWMLEKYGNFRNFNKEKIDMREELGDIFKSNYCIYLINNIGIL